ncbi:DEAD/DEAH box helicase [Nocardioides donggukensis]|uniref:DEAD/DEAH box helicase n=1 Tax=Nocardioides donggukensis TaxID=2774019 RepID=A0A927K3I6_9ACTN|nr:DEAD/DEAH box helicase [Nocardioides donggukensis]MBD8868073.1 DEAD/DEAH box helicase [Nocardioides donggukensis]
MSFVPVTGPATFRAAVPARESEVEFTDGRRTVTLPVRAALPVLTRAHTRDDVHPSVGLLAGAALLGMRFVAAGHLEPVADGWRVGPLDPDDEERVRLLAVARAHAGEADPEALVRRVVDAVADALPRSAPRAAGHRTAATRTSGAARPSGVAGPGEVTGAGLAPRSAGARTGSPGFAARLQARLAGHAEPDERPQLVTLSLRVEADEDELVGGFVRIVLQVHDEQNPLHFCDAATLWTESGPDATHGFGDRARTHATIALRAAAEEWPVLDRLLELRVPDQLTLDAVELASLLDEGLTGLKRRGVDVLWPRSLGADLTSRTVLRPGSGRDEPLTDGLFGPASLFSFSWQLSLNGDPLTEQEMDALAAAASPVIRLRDHWVVVDPATARRAKRRLVRTAKPAQALAATLTGVVTVDEVETEVVVGATLHQVRERLRTAAVREPVPTPAGLAATLRDYQRHGVTWLAEMTGLGLGACLADDMGLGKTVTVIALHLHRVQAGVATGPVLVVCPASLLGNWQAEIERFAPGVPVRRFHGGERSLEGVEGGFVLTTYGTMRSDAAGARALQTGPGWDLVVADEAQHVKNPRSGTAKALRRIDSTGRVALTGTPVENDLTELWAILDWAVPGLLGSRNAFRKVWAAPIEAGVDPAVTRRFAELIAPFLLRRRKSDPGIAPELPAKTETDHLLALTREQVVLYEALVRDSMERIERADEHTRRGLVLALLTGLKQICNHPAHYLRQPGGRLAGGSEKLDLLDELVGTVLAEDGAVLVFTQYVAMARLVEAHLAASGVPTQLLHGGTPVREREAMVRRFQAGREAGGPPVFLLSLKAGGTGLNLTAADHVVHFDRWWNPAVEDQATDRAHRIGQTRPVQVHRMVCQGTIEERVAELLGRKRALADSVLARGEGALTELDDAELRDLVTLRPQR